MICSFKTNHKDKLIDKIKNIKSTEDKIRESTYNVSSKHSIFSIINIEPIGKNETMDCIISIFTDSTNIKQGKTAYRKTNTLGRIEINMDTLGFQYHKILEADSTIRYESCLNRLIGLEYKKFYKKGKLYFCGFESGLNKIGYWKCLSQSGELDSLINYDKIHQVAYCDFFKLAQSFGMIGQKSKMPSDRQSFIKIADSLNLNPVYYGTVWGKPGWIDYDNYPIQEEEKNVRFNSEIGFMGSDNSKQSIWYVVKYFKIGNRSLGFGLYVDYAKKEVQRNQSVVEH